MRETVYIYAVAVAKIAVTAAGSKQEQTYGGISLRHLSFLLLVTFWVPIHDPCTLSLLIDD